MSAGTKGGQTVGGTENITPAQLMLAFGGLFLLNALLRAFYLRFDFVNGDEGVRALSALRMLEGARLYADVVTDKPPGASLFYAGVFALFGHSMKAVHAAAIAWNFATSVAVYLIGARLFNKRLGLVAALFFVYFSTNYFTQDMMAANTELLMALPYAASFYFFLKSKSPSGDRSAASLLVATGVLTGLATLFKQIGVLNLLFFALWEALGVLRERRQGGSTRRALANLFLIGAGFALVIGGFFLWLKSMGALGDFWRNAIVLNMFYIDSEPANQWVKFMIGRGLGYVFFNAVLWSLALWAVVKNFGSRVAVRESNEPVAKESAIGNRQSAIYAVALWGVVSLIGVMMSGRFYGHYFIPALPALSLLAARGSQLLKEALNRPASRRRAQIAAALLVLLLLVGLLRCHHRTAVLAYETLSGTRTHWSSDWGMTKREQEAAVVSDFVRARVSVGEPLYIWGYAQDVYWRTRCRPASRYLTPYYIDGRFADAESATPTSGEQFRREAAANLLEDLRRNRPRLILDVERNFSTLPYAELTDFVFENYRDEGAIFPDSPRPFRVLQLKSEEEKRTEELERRQRKEKRQRERS